MKHTYSASLLLSLVCGTLMLVLVAVFALSALDAWERERLSSNFFLGGRHAQAALKSKAAR